MSINLNLGINRIQIVFHFIVRQEEEHLRGLPGLHGQLLKVRSAARRSPWRMTVKQRREWPRGNTRVTQMCPHKCRHGNRGDQPRDKPGESTVERPCWWKQTSCHLVFPASRKWRRSKAFKSAEWLQTPKRVSKRFVSCLSEFFIFFLFNKIIILFIKIEKTHLKI